MARNRDFDQNMYWIQRHNRLRNDPRSVGHLGKTLEENRSAEKRIQQWVGHAARILKPYDSVLDVGCGYGRIAKTFCDAGYSYTGIDVSSVAIASAKANEPRGSYVVGSAMNWDFRQKFDLVTVLYVFVHFVDDGYWLTLVNNLNEHIRDGGAVLFADELPEEIKRPAPHVTQRPLYMYEKVFSSYGMKLDTVFRDHMAAALGTDAKLPPVYLARKSA